MRIISIVLGFLVLPLFVKAENLIKNPGFEEVDAQGCPDSWVIGKDVTGGARARAIDDLSGSGKYTLLLEQPKPIEIPSDAAGVDNLPRWLQEHKQAGFVSVQQAVHVEGGKKYHFSFRYHSEGLKSEKPNMDQGSFAHFMVWAFWLTSSGGSAKNEEGENNFWVLNQGVNSDKWVEVSDYTWRKPGQTTLLQAPEGAAQLILRFQLVVNALEVMPRVWIDDVVCEEVQ